MRIPLVPLAALCLLAHQAGSAAGLNPAGPVRIESGLIEGVLDSRNAVVSFKGIPYAAPPVGELRWREPQPPLNWDGIRNADRFGAICPQANAGPGESSEDCLFLNLWAPASPAAGKLPVLFFVHGGMYQFGSGNMNGAGIAGKGVIFISVNCRLGKFNSMGHPALTRESPLHSCANYGSLDLIAALQWVRRNISAFGGDPEMVTVAGQSTGASNLHYLSTSPMARGLFRGLIAISFPYDFLMKPDAVGNMWQAEQVGLNLAKAGTPAALGALRAIPAADLVNGGGGPTIRTAVYPKSYPEAIEEPLACDVPTLTGMTWDDFGPPAESDPHTDLALFRKRVARKCPADKLQAVLAEYPADNDVEARMMWKKFGNESRMADIFHWAGKRARHAKTPAYTYIFTRAQPMEPQKGAFHGSDLDYMFNNVAGSEKNYTAMDRLVADQVSSYWVNFVKSGNPNGPGLPQWKAFDPGDPSTMVLGEDSEFRPIATSRTAWDLLHQHLLP